MAISTKEQIIRELARLRMWRYVTGDESPDATRSAHERINALLNLMDAEKTERVLHAIHSQ
jgi:hypothetical protein